MGVTGILRNNCVTFCIRLVNTTQANKTVRIGWKAQSISQNLSIYPVWRDRVQS